MFSFFKSLFKPKTVEASYSISLELPSTQVPKPKVEVKKKPVVKKTNVVAKKTTMKKAAAKK